MGVIDVLSETASDYGDSAAERRALEEVFGSWPGTRVTELLRGEGGGVGQEKKSLASL